MIRITAKKDGFRRAGMAHSGVAEYPAGHFSEHQLVLLRGETLLLVEEIPAGEVRQSLAEKEDTTPEKQSMPGKKAK